MSHDSRTISDDAIGDAEPLESETDRSTVSKVRGTLQRAVDSGAVAGVSGVLCLLDGRRAFRRGDEERGLVSFLLGGLSVAVAVTQRRSTEGAERTGLDRLPAVGSSPAVDDASADSPAVPEPEGEGEVEGEREAEVPEDDGEIAADDTSGATDDLDSADDVLEDAESIAEPSVEDAESIVEPSIEDAESMGEPSVEEARSGAGPTVESDADEPEPDEDESVGLEEPSLERIGEAAFDRQSGEIPVPQRVFNNNVLALNSEVFWGIREADDTVVVSGLFDPIQDEDGVRYVASTQIDGDRMLTVPDAVLNHWDGVAGGGTAVVSGDGLVFGIDEGLRSDDQLRVVPAAWAGELLGEGE